MVREDCKFIVFGKHFGVCDTCFFNLREFYFTHLAIVKFIQMHNLYKFHVRFSTNDCLSLVPALSILYEKWKKRGVSFGIFAHLCWRFYKKNLYFLTSWYRVFRSIFRSVARDIWTNYPWSITMSFDFNPSRFLYSICAYAYIICVNFDGDSQLQTWQFAGPVDSLQQSEQKRWMNPIIE